MSRKIDNRVVRTYRAGSAVTAFSIVVWDTDDDEVKLPASADVGGIVGITLAAASAEEQVEVVVGGCADLYVKASGTNISKGDPIAIHGTTGYGKKSDLTNAKHVLGYASEAATADDVRISVDISKFSTPSA